MATISKEAQLKKLFISNMVVITLVVGVMLAGGIYLNNYNDDMLSDQSMKQNHNNMIASQYKEIEATLGIQNEVATFYDNYTKTHNTNFLIDRENMKALLISLRKANHLTNLDVTASSVSDIPDANLALKSGKAEKSTVRIVFGALSDNSVYNFIYDLKHKLPGIVLISELKIMKVSSLSRENAMMAIKQHNIIPIVTGELSFTWVGIKPNENAQASESDMHNAR